MQRFLLVFSGTHPTRFLVSRCVLAVQACLRHHIHACQHHLLHTLVSHRMHHRSLTCNIIFEPLWRKPAFSGCRGSMPSLSRGQSLCADRVGSQDFTNSPMFWNSVPQPPLAHAGSQSSRSFFMQPSPSAILTGGAPLLLQKKITELVRRQSDTMKWEQKNGRSSEHRDGLSLPQKV